MEGAIYGCPARWEAWLPPEVRRLRARSELWEQSWGVLALTPEGCRKLYGVRKRAERLDSFRKLCGMARRFGGPDGFRKPHGVAGRSGGPDGFRKLRGAADTRRELSCGVLLLPGNCPAERLPLLRTVHAVSYGLSPRESLTFSSLQEPVLCVQRALPGPDGRVIEPQEIPLPGLPAPVEHFLPLLGLWLLCGYG